METEKIFSRKKGFSLIELFVAMIIIAIFTSFITANITSQSQTAKAEAEKLAAYITGLVRKADRRHMGFTIKINSSDTKTTWENSKSTSYDLAPGFSMKSSNTEFEYDANENEFVNVTTITLTRDSDGAKSIIVIGDVDNGGRIRTSEDVL